MNESAFVSDFDGTITDVDVYALIAERYAPKNHPDYFAEYRAGRLTHFEAMQAFFHFAPSEPQAWDRLLRDTKPDPHLADCVRRLDANGWDLLIVSNGSSWYIEQILQRAGVSATIYSNPGQVVEGRGLVLRLPTESPFFSPQAGIDKARVVRSALARYKQVKHGLRIETRKARPANAAVETDESCGRPVTNQPHVLEAQIFASARQLAEARFHLQHIDSNRL